MSENQSPILINDYDYLLPEERIAKYPLEERDHSKLLLYKGGEITEKQFLNIPELIPESSLLVYNNTRVIQARMVFHKESGARIEIFCLEPIHPSDYVLSLGATDQCSWKCLVGNLKKWKGDTLKKELQINDQHCILKARLEGDRNNPTVNFCWNNPSISFAEILDHAGELPIPPYLNRASEDKDKESYQTVYSRIKGSVAAPTAGLHFTDRVFNKLESRNIQTEELTLHVGAGTFQPVKSEAISGHTMHTEVISVPLDSVKNIQERLGTILAVGTTTVRTLESLYYLGLKIKAAEGNFILERDALHVGQWDPYTDDDKTLTAKESLEVIIEYMEKHNLTVLHAQTQILIQPGFHFRIINGMITNFHQPRSTLLLLVSAWIGEDWKKVYRYAMDHDFRFLSYGDSSLLLR